MKLYDLDFNDKNSWLKVTDFENFFKIFQNNNTFIYNLNETLYFDLDQTLFNEYICTTKMYWPLISYKLYGSTHLAWLLMKLNNVTIKDIFKYKNSGDKIKYIKPELMTEIIKKINE